jgi:hypothetical protein
MSQTNRVVRHKTNARKNPHGANHLLGGLRWIVVGSFDSGNSAALTKSG